MAKIKKKPKRNEIFIRISDIPNETFEAIKTNAKSECRSHGKEVLNFLTKNNYK